MGAKLSKTILPSVFKRIPFPGKAAHKVDVVEGHDFEVRNKLYPAPQKRVPGIPHGGAGPRDCGRPPPAGGGRPPLRLLEGGARRPQRRDHGRAGGGTQPHGHPRQNGGRLRPQDRGRAEFNREEPPS